MEDPNKITFFGLTNARGTEVPFGIKRKDRARHMYVIGKTGMGKSTLLENMAIQDIRNGEGIAFIDPHGSTAEHLLDYVPEHRIKDVLYLAPFDMEYPVAFNVMEDVGYDKRHLVVSGLLSAFRKIWVDAWSARMEYILSNVLLALLEYDGATLLDVNRMLVNKTFRKKVVDNVTDPIVKSFWVDEFANYTDRYTQDATPAIQNKVGQFTSNPLIRNIVGQPKSSFDIRKAMDERKIIIINLSKGKVGEVNSTLLGSMLVTKIYLAAMSRADVPAAVLTALPSFYFYVDEFQTFANQSFADILSEARKYKLNLIIAHQYIEQMEEEVRNAVFGNVGTTVAFRVGPFDAEVLETIFNPIFQATDLVNLGFAQIYLTLMIDGVGSPPFSATTMPPFELPPQMFVESVLNNSRAAFAKSRTQVEEAINEWHKMDVVVVEPPKSLGRRPTGEAKREYVRREPTRSQSAVERVPIVPASPSAPASLSRAPQLDPQEVGEQVAYEHAIAASKARNEAQQLRPQSVTPKPTSQRAAPKREPLPPPLSGAKSLREALQLATGRNLGTAAEAAAEEKKKERPSAHAPDLQATLRAIVPTKKEEKKEESLSLPEGELRSMLAVDPSTELEVGETDEL